MYSRDFGEGIRSEGNMEDYIKSAFREAPPPAEAVPASSCNTESEGVLSGVKKLFKNLETDDLILIGIGILLLMDSDSDNDILILLIAFLLFF